MTELLKVAGLEYRDLWIQLSDGETIAASLVMPAEGGPFPVLLSFYPYRKDDFIGGSTAYGREYFAQAGYAVMLVDVRGYGGSSGQSYQTWDPREYDDAAEVVEWAAKQEWCDGRTGVWGASYGGAQSLGVASRRPPSLKAVVSVYGAADVYHSFVYPGSCPNGLGASAWGALMTANELCPPSLPDPEGNWIDAWRKRIARLEAGEISSMIWLQHQDYDEYWRQRRIEVEDIAVPVFFLSGWRDLLCKGLIDAYDRCNSDKWLLAGPWSHSPADVSEEAPYDWLLDIRRFFDHFMKDGAPAYNRPKVLYFVQGASEWRSAEQWPPRSAQAFKRIANTENRLTEEAGEVCDKYEGQALVGVEAGLWYPMGLPLKNTFDQTRDDDKSLTYTSEPLANAIDIVGEPTTHLTVDVEDDKETHLCVKLCHVDPNDRSTLVSSGWLKLPRGQAGEQQGPKTVDIPLYPTAYRIPAGHRIRWTVACADFPRLWPTAETPNIEFISTPDNPSVMTLMVCDPSENKDTIYLPETPPQDVNRGPWIEHYEPLCNIIRDVGHDGATVSAGVKVRLRLPQGGTYGIHHSITAQMQDGKPSGATMHTQAEVTLEHASGESFVVNTKGYWTLGRRHLWGKVAANGEVIYENRWSTFNGKWPKVS